MSIKNKFTGIYIHIPFCDKKCNYCNFYSVANKELFDKYTTALMQSITKQANRNINVDTIYFGGGTPGLIGAKSLGEILNTVKESFSVQKNSEITTELNPNGLDLDFFLDLKKSGFNRISFGMQTSNENELKILGRKHTKSDIKSSVKAAKIAGFDNISVDLMLGVPESTIESINESIQFVSTLDIQHVSAYMLKVEKGTPFYKQLSNLNIPDNDKMAELYSLCIEKLSNIGFSQYEISNFSKKSFESQHNLKYWNCEDYLGFGPSAHSFLDGKRFFYAESISDFIYGKPPVLDGNGGDFEEFAMLKLRLVDGIRKKDCISRFENGELLFLNLIKNTKKCPKDLISFNEEKINLTSKGFAVSNAVILTLIDFS